MKRKPFHSQVEHEEVEKHQENNQKINILFSPRSLLLPCGSVFSLGTLFFSQGSNEDAASELLAPQSLFTIPYSSPGPPWWLRGKESACQGRRPGFDPWVRKMKRDGEKEMATHCSTLAWEIPRTEKRGVLQPTGWRRVGHDLASRQTLLSRV